MQQSNEARLQKRRRKQGQDESVKQRNSGKSVLNKDEQQIADEHKEQDLSHRQQKRAKETAHGSESTLATGKITR